MAWAFKLAFHQLSVLQWKHNPLKVCVRKQVHVHDGMSYGTKHARIVLTSYEDVYNFCLVLDTGLFRS